MTIVSKTAIGIIVLVFIGFGVFLYNKLELSSLFESLLESQPKEPATIDLDLTEGEIDEIYEILETREIALTLYNANDDTKQFEAIAKDVYFPEMLEWMKNYYGGAFEESQGWSKKYATKIVAEEFKEYREYEDFKFKRFKDLPDRVCVTFGDAHVYFIKKDIDGKWKIEEEINPIGPQELIAGEESGIEILQEKDAKGE